MNLTFCGRTHICGRSNNEDAFDMQRITDHLALFAVADGLGGHPAGEVASRIAISTLVDTVRSLASKNVSSFPAQMQEILSLGFLAASRAISDDFTHNPGHAGMGGAGCENPAYKCSHSRLLADHGRGTIAFGEARGRTNGRRAALPGDSVGRLPTGN